MIITIFVAMVGQESLSQTTSVRAQLPAFRGGIDLITLNVTATDGLQRYVTDLARDEFQIFEDGRRQPLAFFQKSGVPLALTLLLDTSASMENKLSVAQDAAVGFVKTLGPADVASAIDFDSRVQILQGFTNDWSALEEAIRRTSPGGSTSLYNAVYIALKELAKVSPGSQDVSETRRQAIVVLSDGEDTSSLVAFDEVLNLAARSNTTIYAIGLGVRTSSGRAGLARVGSEDSPYVLRQLTQQTGGRAFFPLEARELNAVYDEIREELSSQYSLAYESTNPRRDGQYPSRRGTR